MPSGKQRRKRRKPGISVEVIGDAPRHLRRTSEEFRAHALEVLFDEAIQPTADFVESMAKAIAPRRSGLLASSIRQRKGRGKTKRSIKVGPNYRKFPGYFYAPVQEYGSKIRNIRAVFYMRRARRAAKPILERLLAKAMNKAIRTYKAPKPQEKAQAA